MKSLFILILTIAILACVSNKDNIHSTGRLEIIRTDSIRDHFVFKTRNESGNEVTVLAEKDKVSGCKPFKKYIIADSIHQVSAIKSGSRYDLIGFNVSTIDDVKIRDSGELAKIIWNCDCFTDK
jgi:hypothetical protein